jgi:predicted Zn finger-like uncharacterized protein
MSIRIEVDAKGLDFDLAKERIKVECPECKTENAVSLGQVQRQEQVKCMKCGATMPLRDVDGSVGKTVTYVNSAFDEMKNALREIGD